MKIAVIGTGISGMAAAHILSRKYDITVYESAKRLGGHTATVDVSLRGKSYSIDTGFIVFNDRTYPNFKRLLKQLKVGYQPTPMGFSVTCERTGLEYSGDNLDTLFAQRRNLFRLRHWQMIFDILRFNKESIVDISKGGEYLTMTLDEYLRRKNYSEAFVEKYLIPMGSAIWSASTSAMKNFSLQFFVKFFRNHGLLSINQRPQWYAIKGGSRQYIEPLIAPFKDKIQLNTPVSQIYRDDDKVTVETTSGYSKTFDEVVIATHSDQALKILTDASPAEQDILNAIAYQSNEVVLHTDASLLPCNPKTWSSWNYRILNNSHQEVPPVLTYNMNILQSIDSEETFCVTLNNSSAIDPKKIIGRYHYAHPVFSVEAIAAQNRWHEINGVNRTWFCGAYWANGFHEDGLSSALRVTEKFGLNL